MEDSTNYDLDDSLAMGLSYFAAVLDERDDDASTIEELIDPIELSTSLLQVNFVLLAKLLQLTPEEEVADGLEYLELFREEHAARILAKDKDSA